MARFASRTALALSVLPLAACSAQATLLANGSFEGPGVPSWVGWGSDFTRMNVYNDQGLNGFSLPSVYGNFTGVDAADGDQFVAGLANLQYEGYISQDLAAPLTAGQTYRIDVMLHQATRSDLDRPGTYHVGLNTASDNQASWFELGSFTPTVSASEGWVSRSLVFVAPTNAVDYGAITFAGSRVSGESFSYVAMDNVSLNPVPEPASLLVLGLGSVFASRRRARR